MKLAMMRRIAHHTSGEAKPLIPVQENALSGSATSVAPRFKRSSDTNTHTQHAQRQLQPLDYQNRTVVPAMFYFSCRLPRRAESRHLLSFAVEPAKQNATARDSSTSVGMTMTRPAT